MKSLKKMRKNQDLPYSTLTGLQTKLAKSLKGTPGSLTPPSSRRAASISNLSRSQTSFVDSKNIHPFGFKIMNIIVN